MSKIKISHKYEDIISIENLLDAWKDFIKNKKSKKDVQEFELNLMSNIINLHPDKVSIKTLASGVDFLGWVHFPDHRVLRTVTKKRMFKKIKNDLRDEVVCSYLGMLKWGNGYKLKRQILNLGNYH